MTLTARDIFDNDMVPVWREADDSWRHGSYVTEVYKDVKDTPYSYWMAQYRLSADGDTNELREGYASIVQCWPVEETRVVYTTTKPE